MEPWEPERRGRWTPPLFPNPCNRLAQRMANLKNLTRYICDAFLRSCEARVHRELLGRTGILEMKTQVQRVVDDLNAIKGALDVVLPDVAEDANKSDCVHSFKSKIDKVLTSTNELRNGISFMERLVGDLTTYWQIAFGKHFKCDDYYFSLAIQRPRMSHLTIDNYDQKAKAWHWLEPVPEPTPRTGGRRRRRYNWILDKEISVDEMVVLITESKSMRTLNEEKTMNHELLVKRVRWARELFLRRTTLNEIGKIHRCYCKWAKELLPSKLPRVGEILSSSTRSSSDSSSVCSGLVYSKDECKLEWSYLYGHYPFWADDQWGVKCSWIYPPRPECSNP